jgi:hypothetical protein
MAQHLTVLPFYYSGDWKSLLSMYSFLLTDQRVTLLSPASIQYFLPVERERLPSFDEEQLDCILVKAKSK